MTSSRSKLIGLALRRGLRKRCPHCGEGRLFSGWSHVDRCSICGLVFVRNPGDTWFFTIIGDRLPVAAMIGLDLFRSGALPSCVGRDDAGWVGGAVLLVELLDGGQVRIAGLLSLPTDAAGF
jgi:ribosomal protein S27AE